MTDPRTKQEGESDTDVAQRLLLHPQWEGATDSEIAFDGQISHQTVREQRALLLAFNEAQHTARLIGWVGLLPELVTTALRHYATKHHQDQAEQALTAEPVTFLSVLADQGVTLRLVDGDRFVSEPKKLPEEMRAFIVHNRDSIVAELKNARPLPGPGANV